jgi:hypothetical protein
MTTLSKDKRNQLILVCVVTAVGLLSLWFFVIQAQQRNLRTLAAKKDAAEREYKTVRQAIDKAETVDAKLEETGALLSKAEESMASGDVYSWVINALRQFKLPYRVDVPQFSPIDGPKEMNLLPKFPYKQASLTVGGTARYHDLGKFVADLENQFPYFRVVNLAVEPATASAGEDAEKLVFRMDVVVLVKPNAS